MGQAKFYCESCNRLVEYDAEICPHCGKLFDAVKCPVCKHVGRAESFIKGCPKCGYCSPNMNPFAVGRDGGRREETVFLKEKTKTSLMPSWAYYSVAGGLILALIALVIVYITM